MMKRIFLFLAVLPLLFAGCRKEHVIYPYSDFTITAPFSTIVTGDLLTFNNASTHATSYLWDFGDGSTTTALNPTHAYSNAGTYTITLIAYNGGYSNSFSQSIDVHNPTNLVVTVEEITSNLFISGITVYLYTNYNDWYARSNNFYAQGTTNNIGDAEFDNIDAQSYYVDVAQPYQNTSGDALTPVLTPDVTNTFLAWVSHSKKKDATFREPTRTLLPAILGKTIIHRNPAKTTK